jgi:peptidyl-prolyl cis-trans isomerase C
VSVEKAGTRSRLFSFCCHVLLFEMNLLTFLRCSFFAAVISAPLALHAAEPALLEAGAVKVESTDIEGDALRIPLETRKTTLASPESVHQLANNLVIRRALAAQAEAAGLSNDPAIQAAIRIARDRVLSDALFARMDAANKPTAAALDALAITNYKSNPQRFNLPEETSARHILVAMKTPDAKAKAAAILQELKSGADFEKIARERSEDPGSASQGGALGFAPRGRMVAPFEEALAKLQKPGELSDVVETQFGYHIIRFEERRPAGVRPYEQVKDVLRREVELKLLNDEKLAAVQKIQNTVKVNEAAIQEFASKRK